jgi:hypothetical protein
LYAKIAKASFTVILEQDRQCIESEFDLHIMPDLYNMKAYKQSVLTGHKRELEDGEEARTLKILDNAQESKEFESGYEAIEVSDPCLTVQLVAGWFSLAS